MSGEGDAPAAVRWVVSPFTTVSWRGERVEIASATSGATFTTSDVDLVRVLHAFARPRTTAEAILELGAVRPERLTTWIDDFIRAGVLTSASAPEPAAMHHWDPSALAFHRRSCRRAFQKTPGQSTPAVAARRLDTAIPLVRASASTPRDLADVLEARRSWREWPARSIPQETFSTLLWLSARNREREGAPDEYVSRPYPSGGAAYSLELYPVLAPDAVESLAAGVYRYLPDAHALEPVSDQRAEYLPFLEAAARSAGAATTPPIVLIITSRFARQGEEYGELAYSLVLKEVGCLFQTLYLAAEYLGLAPCALGGGTPAGRLARLCNTSELAEPVVGELMLGPRE
jgi:SagB-type dehydrogenase family enzyme